jgi:ankyrin repeat protein
MASYTSSAATESTSSSFLSSEEDSISWRTKLVAKLRGTRRYFFSAAKRGQIDILTRLLESKSSRLHLDHQTINITLIKVCRNRKPRGDQIGVIRFLLTEGANLECKDDEFDRTPMIWAIINKREDIVSFLLEAGALIEARDGREYWTPLIWAVWWGDQATIESLIKKDVDLEATDRTSQRTPLLWAAKRGNLIAVDLILRRKKDTLEAKDVEGMTVLTIAVRERDEMLVQLLIERCTDIEWITLLENQDNIGRTPLLWAITCSDLEIADLLARHGADIDAMDNAGKTALKLANKGKDKQTIEFVKRYQALASKAKLLGIMDESELTTNKAKYSISSFSDISDTSASQSER